MNKETQLQLFSYTQGFCAEDLTASPRVAILLLSLGTRLHISLLNMDTFTTQSQLADFSAERNCVWIQDGVSGRCVGTEAFGFTFCSYSQMV